MSVIPSSRQNRCDEAFPGDAPDEACNNSRYGRRILLISPKYRGTDSIPLTLIAAAQVLASRAKIDKIK
jgi:hypothetical protein